MTRFLIGVLVGLLAAFFFVFYGGADYLRSLGRHADRAAVRVEAYEKKLHHMTESARKAGKKAEEAGKKIKELMP